MQIKYKTSGTFKYRDEVPKKILKQHFDYLDNDVIDGFFKFRRQWYHTSEFERTSIKGWDGAHGDSYFSAVLLKIHNDGETYTAALALS